ncbi:MAG: cation transporter [Acidobacteria bacterium]|nr:cation transporter [Acidobacteriota bacterium]
MGHADHHGHSHAPVSFGRAFAIGLVLNLAFVAVEFVAGHLANSLALVADAGHNLSDVLGLALAWGAAALARRSPTPRRTYGFRRSSILAAVINAVVLLVSVGAIAWEAFARLQTPAPVASVSVIWVAAIGIVINAGTAMLFASGRKGDLNVRGAYLHMVADAAVSLGVVIAAVAMLATGWLWLDPVVSLIVCAVIVAGTWGLLRHSVDLALDAVPRGIDALEVEKYLESLPAVVDVHDLHVWGMSTTEAALTAHLVVAGTHCDDALISEAARELHERFGIEHATLQLENGHPDYPCSCRLLIAH